MVVERADCQPSSPVPCDINWKVVPPTLCSFRNIDDSDFGLNGWQWSNSLF